MSPKGPSPTARRVFTLKNRMKMKYHTLIICILAVAILYPSKAHAFDYPNDQPTIEALISLHKLIKKE